MCTTFRVSFAETGRLSWGFGMEDGFSLGPVIGKVQKLELGACRDAGWNGGKAVVAQVDLLEPSHSDEKVDWQLRNGVVI